MYWLRKNLLDKKFNLAKLIYKLEYWNQYNTIHLFSVLKKILVRKPIQNPPDNQYSFQTWHLKLPRHLFQVC